MDFIGTCVKCYSVAEAGTSAGKDAVSLVAEKIGDWLVFSFEGDKI